MWGALGKLCGCTNIRDLYSHSEKQGLTVQTNTTKEKKRVTFFLKKTKSGGCNGECFWCLVQVVVHRVEVWMVSEENDLRYSSDVQ